MPPNRVHTNMPVKPVKTERTHEENQERAYIAASRRSDRSLEARVESARRASEIHKRRTGRSLRVTEQDVINEEMYEEEDDDLHLPWRYAGLARHLQTNNAELNSQLQATLIAQLGVRDYMRQNEVHTQYEQAFPGTLSNSLYNPYAQGMMSPNMQMNGNMNANSRMNMNIPNYNRQAPYPQNGNTAQGRSASIAAVENRSPSTPTDTSRRHSVAQTQSSTSSSPNLNRTPQPSSIQRPNAPTFTSNFTTSNFDMSQYENNDPFANTVNGMFTTALPTETQHLLGNTFPYSNFDASFMAGYGLGTQTWDFNANAPVSTPRTTDILVKPERGLDVTLAPSAMTRSASQGEFNAIGSANSGMGFFDAGVGFGSQGESVASTPGINGEAWGNFIEENSWADVGGQ